MFASRAHEQHAEVRVLEEPGVLVDDLLEQHRQQQQQELSLLLGYYAATAEESAAELAAPRVGIDDADEPISNHIASATFYDSMVGKLIVHQPTRGEAIDCMLRALGELQIEGIATTCSRHEEILRHAAFAESRIDTTFVERTWD